MIMKTKLATCLFSFALALTALAQDPTATPASPALTSPAATPAPAAPAIAPSPTAARDADEDSLEKRIQRRVSKGLNITIGDDEKERDRDRDAIRISDDNDSWLAIPIVGMVFLTVFATPVMIVALIMYFSMSKTRAMHRTVRMMVEKGQEVPAALLNPPPAQRQRSDMRRGVVLVMVGLGVMVFLGAVNDWEEGAWAIGIIPFLIGVGYLAVWKLEQKNKTDVPPRLP